MKSRKILLIYMMACLFATLFTGCISIDGKSMAGNIDEIRKVCELATTRCYYHNVAEFNNEAGLFGLKSKKLFLEYTGIIEYKIDIDELEIGEPDENGVIEITTPKSVMIYPKLDENSIGKKVEETGLLAKITTEDESKAISVAQKNMEQTANENNELKKQSVNRAKALVEKYYENIGESLGETYRIRWKE